MTTKEKMDKALEAAGQTKGCEISQGATKRVPDLFRKFFPGEQPVVVTDPNTWKAAGEKLYDTLVEAGFDAKKYIMETPYADWDNIEMVEGMLRETGCVPIAVGSGVINDLCKLSSHRVGKRYICFATAASADGYTASSASITKDGSKQTFLCPAPLCIVADVDVLCGAPAFLTVAGYGDLAAKVPSRCEWMIADIFGTEPIIPAAWDVLLEPLDELLDDPEGIAARKPEAVEKLFIGLSLSGIAQQIANSTRPVSCAEHLYSHYLDMIHHTFNGRGVLHGNKVAIGTLTMCAMFDEFFKMDLSKIDVDACVQAWPSKEEEIARATELFKNFPAPELGPESITKKWQSKEEVRKQLTYFKENWEEIKKKIQGQYYSFEKMKDLFTKAGAPTEPEQIGITRADLRKMTDYVQLMRWRINLFDLCKRAGLYDTLLDRVFGKGGAWEC